MEDKAHEVLAYYFRKVYPQRREGHKIRTLDPIDPTIVGKVRVKELRHAGRRWRWTHGAMDMLALGEFSLAPPTGLPAPKVHAEAEVRRQCEQAGIFGVAKKGVKRMSWCGLFTVPKGTTPFDRLICDARPANVRVTKMKGFRLFLLEELLRLFNKLRNSTDSSGQKRKVYIVSRDFRHFFYQLPLHLRMQGLFTVDDLVALVIPMGFHSSPIIGQTTSWIAVLYYEEGESRLGVTLGSEETEMPAYVILSHDDGTFAGFIVVLIDNIGVFVNDEALAEKWRIRLERNAKKFHLIFKRTEPEKIEGKDETDGAADVAKYGNRAVLLEGDNSVVFCGIEFGEQGWRSADSPEIGATEGMTSLKVVASWLGRAYWEVRTRLRSLCHFPDLTALSSNLGHIAYDDPGWHGAVYVTPSACATIRAIDILKEDRSWTTLPPELVGRRKFYATDATETSVAYVELDEGGVVSISARRTAYTEIACNEMEAIVNCVEESEAMKLLIATDNEVCRYVIARGHSKNPTLNDFIRRLESSGKDVVVVRVPTGENVADTPSRDPDAPYLVEQRLDATWRILAASQF